MSVKYKVLLRDVENVSASSIEDDKRYTIVDKNNITIGCIRYSDGKYLSQYNNAMVTPQLYKWYTFHKDYDTEEELITDFPGLLDK